MRRIAIALLAVAAPGRAQEPVLALNPTTMIGYAGTTAGNAYAQRQIGTRLVQRLPARASVDPAEVMARASFRPMPAVRDRVYARLVAQIAKTDAGEAAKLRRILASGEMRNEVAGYLARHGMSANNLVDTTTIYLAMAWLAAHGKNGEPSPAQLGGLRRQVATTWGSTPGALTTNDAVKQEASETNLFQASLASSLSDEIAKGSPAAGQARAAVIRGARAAYQLDLTRLNLTAQGLR